MGADPYDLERFVGAQDHAATYDAALAELRSGLKTGHWMWFVFHRSRASVPARPRPPSLSRRSPKPGPICPMVCWGHDFRECVEVLLELDGPSARQIFGSVDAMKLRSSMTLFLRAAPDEELFGEVLERYFAGEADPATDARI